MGADRKSIHIKGTERFMESDAGWHPTEKRGNRNAFFLIRSLKMRNGRNNTDVLTRYHCFVKRGSFMLISISLMSLYPRFFLSNPSCCKAIFTWNDNIGIWPEYPPEHLLLEFSSMNSNAVCTQVFFFFSVEAKFISCTRYTLWFFSESICFCLCWTNWPWWWLKVSFLKMRIW